jgi:hypothetical protein
LETKARLEVEMADFNFGQRKRQYEAIKQDMTEKELAIEEIRQRSVLERERIRWRELNVFFSGAEGQQRMRNIAGFVIGCMAALYSLRVAAPIVSTALRNYFFKPKLVHKSVKYSPLFSFFHQSQQ